MECRSYGGQRGRIPGERMRIDVLTIFPGMFSGPVDESILGRARESGYMELNIVDLRDFTHDRHRTVDDKPYGGGPGMLMKPEPLFEAVDSLADKDTFTVLLCPTGRLFNQEFAFELSSKKKLLLVCGSYEGVDERVREALIDEELSIGDYVLTNGALPAMVVIDAVTRLLPGVLGDEQSIVDESFSNGLLEYPQYTRPIEYRGRRVPDILISGHHAEIAKWRREQAILRTKRRRPDLIRKMNRDDGCPE